MKNKFASYSEEKLNPKMMRTISLLNTEGQLLKAVKVFDAEGK